jgi:hypothetical protein
MPCSSEGSWTFGPWQGKGEILRLFDRKGGDPAEWPEDLRIRQFPEVAHA